MNAQTSCNQKLQDEVMTFEEFIASRNEKRPNIGLNLVAVQDDTTVHLKCDAHYTKMGVIVLHSDAGNHILALKFDASQKRQVVMLVHTSMSLESLISIFDTYPILRVEEHTNDKDDNTKPPHLSNSQMLKIRALRNYFRAVHTTNPGSNTPFNANLTQFLRFVIESFDSQWCKAGVPDTVRGGNISTFISALTSKEKKLYHLCKNDYEIHPHFFNINAILKSLIHAGVLCVEDGVKMEIIERARIAKTKRSENDEMILTPRI